MISGSKTVVYDTLIHEYQRKILAVENSTDFQGYLIAKPSARNYVAKILALHEY